MNFLIVAASTLASSIAAITAASCALSALRYCSGERYDEVHGVNCTQLLGPLIAGWNWKKATCPLLLVANPEHTLFGHAAIAPAAACMAASAQSTARPSIVQP